MKKIIDSKIYDTDTSEIIFTKQYPKLSPTKIIIEKLKNSLLLGDPFSLLKEERLYKTINGNFFFVWEYIDGDAFIVKSDLNDAKNWLSGQNIGTYEKIFGKIEKA